MTKKFTPGSVMLDTPQPAIAAPPPCEHIHLVPLEFRFAKETFPNGYAELSDYNYATTIMDANLCRVKSYLCLDCRAEIQAPKRKE